MSHLLYEICARSIEWDFNPIAESEALINALYWCARIGLVIPCALQTNKGEQGGSRNLAKYSSRAVTGKRGEPGIRGNRTSNACFPNCIVLICVMRSRALCAVKVTLERVK